MESDLYSPLDGVWRNLNMADFFVDAAKNPEGPVPTIYCIRAVADGLWSAIDIYINKVEAGDKKPSDEYPLLRGRASDWFKKNEPLVNFIRHNRVHYDQPVVGAEMSFTIGGNTESTTTSLTFVSRKKIDPIPIAEVISRLDAACQRVKALVVKQTGFELLIFE